MINLLKLKRGFIPLFSIFLVVLLSVNLKADDFQSYGNKIYYSPDRNIVVITVSNERNLSVGGVYQLTLFDSLNNRSLSVYYNDSLISIKNNTEKVILTEFYVTNTTFTICIKDNKNNTQLILHFIAVMGDNIPIWEGNYPPIDKWKDKHITPKQGFNFPNIPMDNLIQIVLISIILIIVWSYWLGLKIKCNKEHNTTESGHIIDTNYYRYYHMDKYK